MAVANQNGSGARPWGRLWRRLWNSPRPALGCEISQAGISAARWSPHTGLWEAAAWKPIPAGAIEASPLRENIRQPGPVREALRAALESLGMAPGPNSSRRPADAVLVIPDQAARLFVFGLDHLPKRPAERLSLIQFRLKKSVPFDIESAAISYRAQHRAEGRGDPWEVMAVAAPQAVVQQYEAMIEELGLRPRSVVLSTLATLGLLPESAGLRAPATGNSAAGLAGVLVCKYSAPWFTTAFLQGGQLRLFRTVGLSGDREGLLSPQAGIESLYEALHPSIAFFQDNFDGRLEKAYLCGLGDSGPALVELLEREFRIEAAPLVGKETGEADSREPSRQELPFAALMGVAGEDSRG